MLQKDHADDDVATWASARTDHLRALTAIHGDIDTVIDDIDAAIDDDPDHAGLDVDSSGTWWSEDRRDAA